MSAATMQCANCHAELTESDGLPDRERKPCPVCGELRRRYSVHIGGELVARAGLGVKARRAGAKKPFHESYGGPDYSHSRGKHVSKIRVIDREQDRYLEHVEDYQTGEIIHHQEEPLSEHRGHGSAKKKHKR